MALPVTTSTAPAPFNPVTSPSALSILPTTTGIGAVAPDLGVTAGSAPGSGSLTQGTALPNITTTQKQATATPQFYTDYLTNIAKQGATSAQGAQFAGAQPLQEQAFNQVGQNVGNYLPTLNSGVNYAKSVGDTSLADAIGNYGHANIQANLAPQTTAGIVGSGQFGSTRGAGALGQVMANADLGITQQQQQALQQDMANKIAAANSLNSLATTTQNLGLGDTNALATLGGQQQTIAQNEQLFPMEMLTKEANLLKGATIPTATSSSYTGPIPGAYNNSPLAQISGIGATLAGTGLGQTLFGSPATNGAAATSGLIGDAVKTLTGGKPTGGGTTGGGTTGGGNTLSSILGNAYNAVFGSTSSIPSGSYPLADGGTMFVNSDGIKTVMNADGSVLNFDKSGNPLPSGSVDAGEVANDSQYTEQQLYDQQIRDQQLAQQQYDQQQLDNYQNFYD